MSDEPSFDLDAAGLRADGAALSTDVEVLARKLEDALPAMTSVARRGSGRFGRGAKVVTGIEVRVDTAQYALAYDGRRADCTRAQEVRGIVIKREPLALEAWLAALTADLQELAAGSAQTRAALEQLLA